MSAMLDSGDGVNTGANVIGTLPELRWRGLAPVPVEDASYEFSHDQVERKYPYVDGAGHEHTGRGPLKIAVKLLFVNTLAPNLYPQTWLTWRAALFDGSAGKLEHPELGPLQARVLSGSVKLSAHNRGGVTVDVTWVETRDDPDKAPSDFTQLSVSLQEAARAAEAACNKLGIRYPRVQDPPSLSLFEAIQSILGDIYSARLSIFGAINQVLGAVRQMIDLVGLLDPGLNGLDSSLHAWPAIYNLQLLEDALIALMESAAKAGRPVASVVLDTSTTLDTFSGRVGNTIADVIELNPWALGKPSVPAGAVLRFYKPT